MIGDANGQKTPTTEEEWVEEGKKRFGENKKEWKYKCPMCGRVQSFNSIKKEIDEGTFKAMRTNFKIDKDGKIRPSWYSECTSPNCNWAAYGFLSGPINIVKDVNKNPFDSENHEGYAFIYAEPDEEIYAGKEGDQRLTTEKRKKKSTKV